MSSPPQARMLSVGEARSTYLLMVKSWCWQRPCARLVFDAPNVSGMDTPWLYESTSISPVPCDDVLSPATSGDLISRYMFCMAVSLRGKNRPMIPAAPPPHCGGRPHSLGAPRGSGRRILPGPRRDDPLSHAAGGGSSATRRSEIVSSLSWKWGFRNATAL